MPKMSYLEKQPDKRIYASGGMVHIEPIIDKNKFDPHNYNIDDLLELGKKGLEQYKQCKKENIPSEYLTGCKDGLYKMYKALGYYSLVNEQAKALKDNIGAEINTITLEQDKNNLNAIFRDVTIDNMKNKSVYANQHTTVYEPPMTEYQKKIYEKMLLPR